MRRISSWSSATFCSHRLNNLQSETRIYADGKPLRRQRCARRTDDRSLRSVAHEFARCGWRSICVVAVACGRGDALSSYWPLFSWACPGLHYDEAKEAGVNAMELISGAPVTAFRGATLDLFGSASPVHGAGLYRRTERVSGCAHFGGYGRGCAESTCAAGADGPADPVPGRAGDFGVDRLLRPTARAGASTQISLAGVVAATLLAVSPIFRVSGVGRASSSRI